MLSEVREQAGWDEGLREQGGWEVARGVVLEDEWVQGGVQNVGGWSEWKRRMDMKRSSTWKAGMLNELATGLRDGEQV